MYKNYYAEKESRQKTKMHTKFLAVLSSDWTKTTQ